MSAAIQTIWAELVATALCDAGVVRCAVSPGSRSTPLVAALAREPRLDLVTLIDERTAGFFALGAARATGAPVALVCTSGSAAAHYLPAIIEASMAGVSLLAITSDRPPELHDCGAPQTIDQIKLYGEFVRGAFDLGAPVDSELALRAVRRKIAQAIALARGPHPGPVQLELPLRKPLEPAPPTSDAERALARFAHQLAGPVAIAPPQLTADPGAIAELAAAIAAEPDGAIIAGAMPVGFGAAHAQVLALAERAGYPIIAESGSQLRLAPRPGRATAGSAAGSATGSAAAAGPAAERAGELVFVDHFDLIPHGALPVPRLVIQLGAEPVATGWPAWSAGLTGAGRDGAGAPCARWILAGHRWHDAESSAHRVILGDVAGAIERVADALAVQLPAARPPGESARRWRAAEVRAAEALDAALDQHPRSETAVLRDAIAALPEDAVVQLGNSLPIRVIDHACPGGGAARPVLTQRGAAGIDGLIASAAGATWAGRPVLLVLGDVSFAHDLGGLLAARAARAPLAILVIDNRGGQIFAGLPVARSQPRAVLERHWLTPPELDPVAVAAAIGLAATIASSPAAVAAAVVAALATPGAPGVSVIHAPVSPSGAHDVRRTALEQFASPAPLRAARGGSHD
jgi:2-succinyl-5-enolpyruvyl-6-hydroxy-3-cyclohexene-1-carboxylate synthase